MEKLVKEIIEDALCRAEREVAEYGSFTFSEKKFDNPDKKLAANKFWLGIEQAPKGTENYQTMRGLKLYAQKKGATTEEGPAVEVLLKTGGKKDILNKIKENDFAAELLKYMKELSDNLIDL